MLSFFGGIATSANDEHDGSNTVLKHDLPPPDVRGASPTSVRSFEDLDALESGDAREFIPESCLQPPEGWWLCRVTRKNGAEFCMALETNASRGSRGKPDAFVLSAKRVGDDFYISRYEAFPSEGRPGEVPAGRYCAVLRAVGADGLPAGARPTKPKAGERRRWELLSANMGRGFGETGDVLASATHSWFKHPMSGADVRTMDACLEPSSAAAADSIGGPVAMARQGSRDVFVWDANQGRHRMAREAMDRRSSSNSLSSDDDASRGGGGEAHAAGDDAADASSGTHDRSAVAVASQIPRWDNAHGCLVMKFLRQRVKESSSKNMVIYPSSLVRASRAGGSAAASSATPPTTDAVMQFGKTRDGEYALDFKGPVAPLQAFGVALSSFAFGI